MKFITVLSDPDAQEVLVQSEQIQYCRFSEIDDATRIYFTGGNYIDVIESLAQIMSSIEEATNV